MNQIGDALLENDIEFSYFHEPDLNHALSALCFIADERVFDRELYPDFVNYLINNYMVDALPQYIIAMRMTPQEELEKNIHYKEWVRLVGGVKNVFLRDLIKDKKLAR